jgi:hypothetical protein
VYRTAPAFKRARMHGGNPVGNLISAEKPLSTKGLDIDHAAQVYGYTGWSDSQGYVSIHNPTTSRKSYAFTLDRKLGLVPGSGPFRVSFPMAQHAREIKPIWSHAETVTAELQPHEIVIMNFDQR